MSAKVSDAARLVRFAFFPRLLPAREPEYLRLVRAYQADTELQDLTEQIAVALGLTVVVVSAQTGIVAWAEESSPFATTIGAFLRQARSEQHASQRVTFGVALLAIWRLCYPSPAHLDDLERVPRVSVDEVVRFVDGLCDRLDREALLAEEEVDPPVGQPGLERSWRAWARRGRSARNADGRRSARSTPGIVGRALEWMAEQGLVDKVSDAEEGTFRARARLRVLVAELAGSQLYAEVLALGPPQVDPDRDDPGRIDLGTGEPGKDDLDAGGPGRGEPGKDDLYAGGPGRGEPGRGDGAWGQR